MFDAFLRHIGVTDAAPVATVSSSLALAVLLVRVARADQDYSAEETSRIDAILAKRHGLSPDGAAELRAEAEEIESRAPDNVKFTRILKDDVAYEERAGLVEALWEVILSDDFRHYEENAFMRLVAHLLGVSDRDSGFARQKVERARRET